MHIPSIVRKLTDSTRNNLIAIYLVVFIFIVFSRVFCIDHEITNHPDEFVFEHSAVSIVDSILHSEKEYSEVKPYPEGSYFFFAPFQLLEKVVRHVFGPFPNSVRFMNRLGSVVYFALGAIIACDILLRFFKSKKSAVVFGVLIIFSLFHIEQSRYGTGDAISFLLLMLSIHSAALFLQNSKNQYLLFSSLFIGIMAAVKYPLVYFFLVPIGALLISKSKKNVSRILLFMGSIACMLIGFFAFSPGPLKNLNYLSKVSQRELTAYVYVGNPSESGGIFNHLFSTLAYWFLYADFLFSPIFFALGISIIKKNKKTHTNDKILSFLQYVLPISSLGFLGYNMLVTTLFMRTLYPFFCIALLYTSYSVGHLLQYKKSRRLVVLLLVLTVVRGSWLIKAYIPKDSSVHLANLMEQAETISGNKRVVALASDVYLNNLFTESSSHCIPKSILQKDGFPMTQVGDTIVTGCLEFGVAQPYPLRIADESMNLFMDGWKVFKEENISYYIGQSYPQYYGYLFGFWIKGSNLCKYDFPMNYVYAVPK